MPADPSVRLLVQYHERSVTYISEESWLRGAVVCQDVMRHRARACRDPGERHFVLVASKQADILPYPGHCKDLVEKSCVYRTFGINLLGGKEAEGAQL